MCSQMAFGGGTFGRGLWWGEVTRVGSLNGISSLVRRHMRKRVSVCAVRTRCKGGL